VRQLILGREQDEAAIKSARKTLPFLVIQGTADKHLLVDNMEKSIKSRFDIVEFLRMEGVGHAAFYEQPETVNRTILAFIQRIVAKANVNIL
jgi:pimeloyl-ACP methyl ester carboxylesterase